MTARSPRDELRLALALQLMCGDWGDSYGTRLFRDNDALKDLAIERADKLILCIETFNGGCWIAPNEPNAAMISAGRNFAFRSDDAGVIAFYEALRDHAPYAAEKKDATTATEKESA